MLMNFVKLQIDQVGFLVLPLNSRKLEQPTNLFYSKKPRLANHFGFPVKNLRENIPVTVRGHSGQDK